MSVSKPLINARISLVLVQIIAIVAILHFADDVLVPVALALMLAFLLTPVVHRLERWGMARPLAVAATTLVTFALLAAIAWMVAQQFRGLIEDLPSYRSNLMTRIRALDIGGPSRLERGVQTVQELSEELQKAAPGKPEPSKVAKVQIVEPPPTARQLLRSLFGPLIGPASTAAIVIVFVIFMLLQREDLRDRLVRLLGASRMPTTVTALNDAARRVSRYLMMQTLINTAHGAVMTVGLWLIGVPDALLWGALTIVLRFIPYLGPVLAAAGPIVLSLAVFPGWNEVLMVVGLIVAIELISNNVLEPRLYGSSVGVSSFALIVATVFWTWLWGAAGLLLATPLTVCLAVMGKHIPQLGFMNVLLGDQPVLAPAERFYQRLLAGDADEAQELIDEELEQQPLPVVLDSTVMPALRFVEQDHERGVIDDARRAALIQTVVEFADTLPGAGAAPDPVQDIAAAGSAAAPAVRLSLVCLPAADAADEVAAQLMVRALPAGHFKAEVLSTTLLKAELLQQVTEAAPDVILVSAMPPGALLHARYLCRKLRNQFPDVPIVVALWDAHGDLQKATTRLSSAGQCKVVNRVGDAIEELAGLRRLRVQGVQVNGNGWREARVSAEQGEALS